MQTWMTFLLSFLGGGVLNSVITAVRNSRAEVRQRKIAYLEAQLQRLYGPVYLYLLKTRRLIDVHFQYQDAWKHLRDASYTEEQPGIQAVREQDGKETWKLVLESTEAIQDNNRLALAIIDQNAAYLDPDDISLVMDLFEDVVRSNLERTDEPGVSRITQHVAEKMGDAYVIRPELYARIEQRFQVKQRELTTLVGLADRKEWLPLLRRRQL